MKSGIYRLIDEKLGAPGLACLKDVDVRGDLGDLADGDAENFQAEDEKDVSQAILELANELDRRKQYAKTLRTLLSERSDGFTWPNSARSFVNALRLPTHTEIPSNLSTPPVVSPSTSAAAPTISVASTGETTLEEQPLLKLPEPGWDRERGHSESQLLRPEDACVPFHESRRQLLNEVLTWATSAEGLPAEIQFRIGSAGAGKTRLMLEVCRELVSQGWNVGFLTSPLQQDLEKTFKRFLSGHSKTFVVVDYAETRRREVVELMRAAFAAPKQHRLRIMLLARDKGEWWDRLATEHPTLEKFITGRAVRGPYRIPEIPVEAQSRETIFREALTAFALRLDKDPTSIRPPDLSAPHFANVLFIHLAAMASLFGERPETATNLLEAILRHERRYWHEAARAQGLPDALAPGLDQAVAIITLRSGAKDTAEARSVLQSVPRLRGARPDELDRVLEVLRIFYPLAGGIDALRPDILGERLISQELAKDDAPLDVVLGKNTDEMTSRSALTVLNRLARQSPSDVIWLQRSLQQNLALRAGIAVTVAIESGDPIGTILAEALENAPNEAIWDLAEPLRSKMPHNTLALRECALVLAQLRLKRLKAKGAPVGSKQKAKLAEAYLDLGNRLSGLGEHRKALAAYEESRRFFQERAKSYPSRAANLAGCLTNASYQLAEIGRYAEALQWQREGVGILRELVASHPRSFQYTLGVALNNLSISLRELGFIEEAYRSAAESLKVRRSLTKNDPGQFLPDMGSSLANVAAALSTLGRHEEALHHAQQAAALWHDLAETNPDAAQPGLAMALIILTLCWIEQGRYKEARDEGERAVQIARALARLRPDAFRNQLGLALGSLAVALRQLGQSRKSLELASESLAIQKVRASTEPTAAFAELAFQHANVAGALMELGRHREALPYAEEGLALLRKLVQERPEAFRFHVVGTSTLVARLLIVTERLTEARDLLTSDKPLFEELRQGERARAVIPVHAGFLATLALAQFRLNQFKEATEDSRSATELFEESLRDRPLAYRAEASAAWRMRSSCEAALGETENSQRSATRGLELLQIDLVETPRQLSPWMLDVAHDLIRRAGPLAAPLVHSAVYDAVREAMKDRLL